MGIDDFAVTAVYPARQYIGEYDEELDYMSNPQTTKGYLVYFGRELNGYTTPWITSYLNESCFDFSGDSLDCLDSTFGYEGIVATVTDEGIESFKYLNPMKVSEITTEQASVTSFESINQTMMDYLAKERADTFEVDTIRLCMGRVRYDDSYALVPVWCYEYNWSDANVIMYRSGFIINALDGTIIDPDSGIVVEY